MQCVETPLQHSHDLAPRIQWAKEWRSCAACSHQGGRLSDSLLAGVTLGQQGLHFLEDEKPEVQHELVKFGDGDRVVEQLEIDRCESTEIIHSTPIVEDCEHLLFARDALELLHREHLKLEVALHAWYVECNFVQQVVHEVESVYLALFRG